MESRKRKVGLKVEHKTKAILIIEEVTEHYYYEFNQTIKDSMEILEEEVHSV
jgi:hypothetical protein